MQKGRSFLANNLHGFLVSLPLLYVQPVEASEIFTAVTA
jgi:hypothetical protein